MPKKALNHVLGAFDALAKNLKKDKRLSVLVHPIGKARKTNRSLRTLAATQAEQFQADAEFILPFLKDNFQFDITRPILIENTKVKGPVAQFGLFQYNAELIKMNQLTAADYVPMRDLQHELSIFYTAIQAYLQQPHEHTNALAQKVHTWITQEIGSPEDIARYIREANLPIPAHPLPPVDSNLWLASALAIGSLAYLVKDAMDRHAAPFSDISVRLAAVSMVITLSCSLYELYEKYTASQHSTLAGLHTNFIAAQENKSSQPQQTAIAARATL